MNAFLKLKFSLDSVDNNLNLNNLNDLSMNNICNSEQIMSFSSNNEVYPTSDSSFAPNRNQIRIESTLDRDHRRAVSLSAIKPIFKQRFVSKETSFG